MSWSLGGSVDFFLIWLLLKLSFSFENTYLVVFSSFLQIIYFLDFFLHFVLFLFSTDIIYLYIWPFIVEFSSWILNILLSIVNSLLLMAYYLRSSHDFLVSFSFYFRLTFVHELLLHLLEFEETNTRNRFSIMDLSFSKHFFKYC